MHALQVLNCPPDTLDVRPALLNAANISSPPPQKIKLLSFAIKGPFKTVYEELADEKFKFPSGAIIEHKLYPLYIHTIDNNNVGRVVTDVTHMHQFFQLHPQDNPPKVVFLYKECEPTVDLSSLGAICPLIRVNDNEEGPLPERCHFSIRELSINFGFGQLFTEEELKYFDWTNFHSFQEVREMKREIQDSRERVATTWIGVQFNDIYQLSNVPQHSSLRILDGNGMMTMDHIPSRLNIVLNPCKMIERVYFG